MPVTTGIEEKIQRCPPEYSGRAMSKNSVSRRTFIKQGVASAGSACVGLTVSSRHGIPAELSVIELQKLIPSLMTEIGVPGLSIALIRDAKILWHQGFGLRNIATKEPVTSDCVMASSSTTTS
jgi:hypothetical protein